MAAADEDAQGGAVPACLAELLRYEQAGDTERLDQGIATLDAAGTAWPASLSAGKPPSFKITAALPLLEPEFELPLPRLRPRRAGKRLLVFVQELLSPLLTPLRPAYPAAARSGAGQWRTGRAFEMPSPSRALQALVTVWHRPPRARRQMSIAGAVRGFGLCGR